MSPPARRGREEGFSLIELMVALTLLVVVIVPLTGLFYGTLRTASAANIRTDATAIGVQQVEAMHAVPYDLLGFYSDQVSPAPSPTWSGTTNGSGTALSSYTTVTLPGCSVASVSCTSPDTLSVTPESVLTSRGVSYTVDRYVYWTDFSAADTQAYKGVSVTVQWADRTGAHKIEEDSLIYPGGRGPYAGAGSATTTTTTTLPPSAPNPPTIAETGIPTSTEIDVSITPSSSGTGASYYYVQYATDSAFSAPVQSAPVYQTSYQAQNLSASTGYWFRAVAVNSAGQSAFSNAIGPIATAAPSSSTCALNALKITTAITGKTYLDKYNKMTENIGLSLSTSGTCSAAFSVQSVLDGATNPDPASPYTLAAVSGGSYSGTVNSSGQPGWSVGTHDMTVYQNGAASSPVVTHGLLVCAYLPPGQRSSSPNQC